MSAHGYESGRLNLPFVGICTFGKSPLCLDWDNIKADVAIVGCPIRLRHAVAFWRPLRAPRHPRSLHLVLLRPRWSL